MPNLASRNSDPRTTAPRYVRVYTALREWIDSGKYSPGEKIASEEEIGQMFGVSRITTRKAIDLLVEDDLVYRLHGKGTYVADNVQQRSGMANIGKRIRDARRVMTRGKLEQVEIEEIDADPKTCIDLKLSAAARVLRISYVRTFAGERVAQVTCYIPAEFGVSLEASDLRNGTTLDALEASGLKPDSASQLISATLADASLSSTLDLNMGSPVLRIKQIVVNSNQDPLERIIVYVRGRQVRAPYDLAGSNRHGPRSRLRPGALIPAAD